MVRRLYSDDEGIEVSSLEQAHGEALDAIKDVLLDKDSSEIDLEGWALDVVDPAGRVLLSMNLEDAVEAPRIDSFDDSFDVLH